MSRVILQEKYSYKWNNQSFTHCLKAQARLHLLSYEKTEKQRHRVLFGESFTRSTCMEGPLLCITLGCTPSSVSSLPAGPQMPQCRHNVEQSLGFQVVSGIWLKRTNTYLLVIQRRFPEHLLPLIRTCWLLPYCQTALGGWTARSTQWRRKLGDWACGGSSHSRKEIQWGSLICNQCR